MKQHWLIVTVLGLLLTLAGGQPARADTEALVRIVLRGDQDLAALQDSGLSIYAHLSGSDGPYVLAGASWSTIAALQARRVEVILLDPEPGRGTFFLAQGSYHGRGDLLLDDGRQVLLRIAPREAEELARQGQQIAALDLEPITLEPRTDHRLPASVEPEAQIDTLMAAVDPANLLQLEQQLTGVTPVNIDGQPYTIATRYTYSTTQIQKATQFVYEHLSELDLTVSYHQWGDASYPNVIAIKPGVTHPEQHYVICAHLDDRPPGPVAPGADDNASGSIGVLVAADLMSQHNWDSTLVFALWTGEEQGLLGSDAWAEMAANQGMDIQAVLNLDMIAYNSDSLPIVDLYTKSIVSGSSNIAYLFRDVVDAYDLALAPNVLIDGTLGNYSDNRSFWDQGYAAILAIEDDDDFTPYYHTTNDTVNSLNLAYYTEIVRAAIGSLAHMAGGPLVIGWLEGTVTDAATGSELADVQLIASDDSSAAIVATTDPTGYYSMTLPAGTFTIHTQHIGYLSATFADVTIIAGQVTTLDASLEASRIYLPLCLQG